MKKKLFLLVVSLCACCFGYAQRVKTLSLTANYGYDSVWGQTETKPDVYHLRTDYAPMIYELSYALSSPLDDGTPFVYTFSAYYGSGNKYPVKSSWIGDYDWQLDMDSDSPCTYYGGSISWGRIKFLDTSRRLQLYWAAIGFTVDFQKGYLVEDLTSLGLFTRPQILYYITKNIALTANCTAGYLVRTGKDTPVGVDGWTMIYQGPRITAGAGITVML